MSGQFTADISRFVAKANGNVDLIVRKVIFEIGTRIVMRSPVGDAEHWKHPPPKGYAGGRFRANWQYGYGAPPTSALDTIDPSGATSIAAITAGAAANPSIGVHYLVNNLPYAKRLEEGWSRQAPKGMVELTAIEFSDFVRGAVKDVAK